MIQFLGMADNATVNLPNRNYFNLNNIAGGLMEMIDGVYYNGTTAYIYDTVNEDFTTFTALGCTVANSNAGNAYGLLKKLTYDPNNSWIMLPAEVVNNSGSSYSGHKWDQYYCEWAKVVNHSSTTNGMYTSGGFEGDGDQNGLFNYVADDSTSTSAYPDYYTTRLLYIPQN